MISPEQALRLLRFFFLKRIIDLTVLLVFGISLTLIEKNAFASCDDLESVELVGHGVRACGDGTERLDTPGSDSGVVAQYFNEWRSMYSWTFEPAS